MRWRSLLCLLVVIPALASSQALGESLLGHLVAMWDIPDDTEPSQQYAPEIYRMELDVTGDGKVELFLGTSWGGSRRGIPWVVYTLEEDGRYRPLGTIEFSYESFYYSATGATVFTPRGAGPGTGGDFAYYHIGADGIWEIMDPVFGSPEADLVKLDAWSRKGRPPMYVTTLKDLRSSPNPQWRESVTGEAEPSLGRLEGQVTETGACSAERFLKEYRGAGCIAIP
jgi:hypothetical protein